MDKKWKIEYYKTTSGKTPVEEFILKLDAETQSKIGNILDLLKEYGIDLGFPHTKKLTGTPLWELRVLGRDNVRILYITQTGKTFLLLHGFQKKKQKTDKKEVKTAIDRLIDHKSRTQN